jgi:hypothetical protein
MGHSGVYKGSGGKDAKALRDAVADYVDLDSSTPAAAASLDAAALRRVINLIRPRTQGGQAGDGPGGGGGGTRGRSEPTRGGGGPRRSAAASARTAGRAAAAANAYATGDAATLQRLGLDYDELRGLGDDFEVLRRIVDSACAAPDSTIEDHEQRLVAAEVAEWVLAQEREGTELPPEQIVRQAIATIIAVTLLVETGELINMSNHADLVEREIRDAAEALAAQATLSAEGASEAELSQAVESGLETIRAIVKGGD